MKRTKITDKITYVEPDSMTNFTSCAGIIVQSKNKVMREEKIIQKLEAGMTKQDIIQQGVFFSDKEKVQEPMKFFLYTWDTIMYKHHEDLIKEGGLMKFFPEIKTMLKAS